MQYDVSTPKEYFEVLEEDWRKEKLQQVRDMILSKGTDIEESIEYKMLRYGNTNKSVFHLNAQANFVGLYVGDVKKIDTDGTMLKGFDMGKGCIRIKKSTKLEESQIEAFIEKTIGMWRNKEAIDC